VLGKDVGAKVRKLIDDHVISLGIDPKIPPIQLTDAEFDTQLARTANDRAKASEMEHAIRSHIRKHADADPVLYRKLSERLNDILKNLGEQWNELIAQLQRSSMNCAPVGPGAAIHRATCQNIAPPSCVRSWMWWALARRPQMPSCCA
jgi:hypothetical protein